MSLSHAHLRRWYTTYNRKYFGGKLPEDMDVFYAPDDEAWEWAEVSAEHEKSIQVDTTLMETRWAKISLIHGMNHHYTNDWTHGRRFQAGMMRLAALGAFKNIW